MTHATRVLASILAVLWLSTAALAQGKVTLTQTVHVDSRAALAALSTAAFNANDPVWLEEAGREGFFKWSSANLSTQVTADPGQVAYVPPASDTDGSSGAYVRQFQGAVSSDWAGAICDGVTNDTVAFQNLATFINATEHPLYIPAGDCLLRAQITFTGTVSIEGAGREKTALVWDASATGVGLKITYADADDRSLVRDLSFSRTGTQNDGTALAIDGSAQVSGGSIQPRAYLRAVVRDVEFLSAAIDGGASFAIGLLLDDILTGEIEGFSFRGSHTSGDVTDNLGTAIKLTHDSSGEPVSPHLRGITVYRAAIAIDALHHEGVYVSQFEFVAVNTGIYWHTDTGSKPQLIASDGHISAYEYGINAVGLSQYTIHDVLFYRRSDATVSPYYHIYVDDSDYGQIHSNHFADLPAVKAAVDISLVNGGLRNIIGPNNHQSGLTAISIDATTDDTYIAEQNGSRTGYTNWLLNNGTRTKKAGFRTTVRLTADEVLTTAVNTAIPWDAVAAGHNDVNSEIWAIANPTRLVAYRTGVYDLHYNIIWESTGTGNRRVAVFKNGTVVVPGAQHRASAIAAGNEQTGALLRLALTQGEYLEVMALQDSGADRSVLANSAATLAWVSD